MLAALSGTRERVPLSNTGKIGSENLEADQIEALPEGTLLEATLL